MPEPTALQIAEQIIELIEDELPSETYDKDPTFFAGVLETTKDIKTSLEQIAVVPTPAQEQALRNMLEGVQKWFH